MPGVDRLCLERSSVRVNGYTWRSAPPCTITGSPFSAVTP